MSSYNRVQFPLTKSQVTKIRKAINNTTPAKLKMTFAQLGNMGQGSPLFITSTQLNRLNKNLSKGKGAMLSLSAAQTLAMKKDGGILPILVPLLITGATALATGALGAVGAFAADKVIDLVDTAIGGALPKFTDVPGTNIVIKTSGNGLGFNTGQGLGFDTGQGLFPFGTSGNGLFPLGVKHTL